MIGRGADCNLESSLRLNFVFTTRILYSSVISVYYSHRVISIYMTNIT